MDTKQIFETLDMSYNPDNIYYQTITSIIQSADRINLSDNIKLILAQPKNEVMVHFPVHMDNGEYKIFKGYRVQHNNLLGPYKGGIRFHAEVSLDHVKALSALMTMKNALIKLPLGGGKGGIKLDPRSLSQNELMKLSRRFVSALGKNIGPGYDIPAPDVGTNAQIMAWMADTYANITSTDARLTGIGVVTGKPLEFGGSHGREKATGQGVVYVIEEMLPALHLDISQVSYNLIGFGNVGSWTARLLKPFGAKLTSVMDHTGIITNPEGLDPDKLAKHVAETGGVGGYPKGEDISEDDFYSQDVDMLIPAALEQMIGPERAAQLKCKVLVEAANAPCTPQGENILMDRGIQILPAILCNAGGVTVSYFEWKQNRQAEQWSARRVDENLKEMIVDAAKRVTATANRLDCDMRTAAYCTALDHFNTVYQYRGIFP